MYLLTKTKFKNFLLITFSIILTISMALFTACSKDNGNDNGNKNPDTETTSVVDYQTITNGDFEFSTTDTTNYPYSSSIGWTRSSDSDKTTSTSSSLVSGIIDTKDSAFEKLAQSNERPPVNPKTPKAENTSLENNYDAEDEEKRVNPNVDGTKILMIANKSSVSGLGTAQKFKSNATITVPAYSYAVISLWVRTDNLKTKAIGKTPGAYVLISDKVASADYKGIELTEINTNSTWKRIETVIKGNDFASSTFTITLGLGRGNGTFTSDYVEGYAFFDNVQATVYSKEDYDALNKTVTFDKVEKSQEVVKTVTDYTKPFGFDLTLNDASLQAIELNLTSQTGLYNVDKVPSSYKLNEGNEIKKSTANEINAGTNNTIKTAISDVKDIGKENPEILYFDFQKASTGYYVGGNVKVGSDKRHLITFFAKTYAEHTSANFAKITVIDVNAVEGSTDVVAFDSFTTESISSSIYGSWVKYAIVLHNPTENEVEYQLKFSFGDTTEPLVQDAYLLQKGYAIFADIKATEIDKDSASVISSSSTAYVGEVKGNYEGEDSAVETSNDVYAIETDRIGNFEISTKPTTYISSYTYKGTASKNDVQRGIINSKYVDKYDFLSDVSKIAFKNQLKAEGNTYAQAIVLNNKNKTNSSLISETRTLNANSCVMVTLKVRVADANAKANIYLVTTEIDSSNNFTSLSVIESKNVVKATVDKNYPATLLNNGWAQVTFFVSAGKTAISYKVEVWNGDKNATNENGSQGAIFLQDPVYDTASIATHDALLAEFDKYDAEYTELNLPFTKVEYTRKDATILSTNEDGETVETIKKFDPTVVYATNSYCTFIDFTTIDCSDVIDNTTQEDKEETTPETEEEGYAPNLDVGLQISSIAIAVVIIAVLIVVLLRKVIKKKKNDKEKIRQYYSRNTRDEALAKISKKKARVIDLDVDEEVTEYDYTAAEQVDESEQELTENTEDSEETQQEAENEPNQEQTQEGESSQETKESNN